MQTNAELNTPLAEQLADLLADSALTALGLDGPDRVWLERSGRRQDVGPDQAAPEFVSALLHWAESLAIGKKSDGEVLSFSLELFTSWTLNMLQTGPADARVSRLYFVRNNKASTLTELKSSGFLPDLAHIFLRACLQARRSILYISPDLSAAQNVMIALVSESAENGRVALVSPADSGPSLPIPAAILPLRQSEDTFTIAAKMGRDQICLNDLAPDRAPDMAMDFVAQLPAWPGSCACLKAAYADSAMLQLAAGLNNSGYGDDSARKMIMASFELIVEIGRDAKGQQRIQRIVEIDRQAEWPGLGEVFATRLADDDEAAVPVLMPTGLLPHFWTAFAPLGVSLDAQFFDPQTHGFSAPLHPERHVGQAPRSFHLAQSSDLGEFSSPGADADLLSPPHFPLRGKQESATKALSASADDVHQADEAVLLSDPHKPASDLSLDHAVPQGISAAVASDAAVADGLAVDASFADSQSAAQHLAGDAEQISDDPGWEVEVLRRQPGALPEGGPPEDLPQLPEHLQNGLSPDLRRSLSELLPDLAEDADDKKHPGESAALRQLEAGPNYKPQPPLMHPQALQLQSQLEAPAMPASTAAALPSQEHQDNVGDEVSKKPLKGL